MTHKIFCNVCEKEITDSRNKNNLTGRYYGWKLGEFHEKCFNELNSDVHNALKPLEEKYKKIDFKHFILPLSG
jgi:hypothetical protein